MGTVLKIADLRHKVKLCSQHDVVTTGGVMVLARKEILPTWAKIEEKRGSMHAADGKVIRENREVRSHRITLRYRTDLDIGSTAWVYEERLKSPPRWFKVLNVADTSDAFVLDVRLIERGEDVIAPVAPNGVATPPDTIKPRAKPENVKL